MGDLSGGVFPITDAEIKLTGVFAIACTIPGTCVCFMALVAYAIAAFSPRARGHLDRVSFRLLVYTLVSNVLFGIAYAATAAQTSPGPGCNFGAFAVNLFLGFSTFFTTCIAINLQLVVVHGINGKMMEKYYVICTTILVLALNVPAFALHHFGWDEELDTCWYKDSDNESRLRWMIGTQSFWISLAATIETICSSVVIIRLYRLRGITDALDKTALQHNLSMRTTPNGDTSILKPQSSSMSTLVIHDVTYRRIILRIAFYPIVSLLVNYTTVALDLNTTIRGLNTQLDFRLLVLDLMLYGFRTLAYGLLAAMDPSFIKAIRELRASHKHSRRDESLTLTNINFATSGHGVPINSQSHSTTQDERGKMVINTALHDGHSEVPEHRLKLQVDVEKPMFQFEDLRRFERQL